MTELNLDNLYIAKPCNAKWEDMEGNDKVRNCGLCAKNVYNISNMTKTEAEDLLRENGASVCVGYFRRKDGTIITDDCPVGLKQFRNGMRLIKKAIAASIGILISSHLFGGKAAYALEEFRTRLIAQGARFGGAPNVWRRNTTPLQLMYKERANSLAPAVFHSENIVIAQFIDYRATENTNYYSAPIARYKILDVLKGNLNQKTISTKYLFHDESELQAPPGWKFSDSLMPRSGDVFILFLTPLFGDKIWSTYNGSFGRYEYNSMNRSAVKVEIARQRKLNLRKKSIKRTRHFHRKAIPSDSKSRLGFEPKFIRKDKKQFLEPKKEKIQE